LKKWNETDDSLWLLTREEIAQLPQGTVLTFIIGGDTRPVSDIDFDRKTGTTWCGHTFWGIRKPFDTDQRDLFLIFLLKEYEL
jgi:hypothetical protein